MTANAIIVASGTGSRLKGLDIPKQFYRLDEKTILYHSVMPFQKSPLIDKIIIVCLYEWLAFCKEELKGLSKIKKVAVGGKTRQQSVFNGLAEVDEGCTLVAVHDGARPFVTEQEISSVINAAKDCAATLGTRVSDTIKLVNKDGFVEGAPRRELLWAVQTPQVLPYDIFKAASIKAESEGISVTDDVSLAELLGYPVKIIEGSPSNIKITYESDLVFAKALLANRRPK